MPGLLEAPLMLPVPNPVGVAFVLVGAWFARKGLRAREQRDRVADVETTPVRALSEGPVQLEGTAHPLDGRTLARPFAPDEDALVYEVEVEEAEGIPGWWRRWKTVHVEREAVPFVVEDDDGDKVVVEPATEGEWVLDAVRYKTGMLRRTADAVSEYVERTPELELGGADLGVARLPGSDRRYTERALLPGENVYVLGEATTAEDLWDAEHPYSVGGDAKTFVLGDRREAGVVAALASDANRRLAIGGVLVLVGLATIVSALPGVSF